MDFETTPTVVSGREYAVTQVGLTEMFVMDDLLGEATMVLFAGGQCHSIVGVGSAAPFGVRFYEKDPHRHGHDIRVWRIARGAENVITAVHDAAF